MDLCAAMGPTKKAAERLIRELAIINEMRFNAYFLITWDMIRYAQSRGFYHVGRGAVRIRWSPIVWGSRMWIR